MLAAVNVRALPPPEPNLGQAGSSAYKKRSSFDKRNVKNRTLTELLIG